jgi:hypothetical protein
VEWTWHKYPWYIQSFNIGAHAVPVFLAGLAFGALERGAAVGNLDNTIGMVAANVVFVFGNHFLVGMVVRLARGRSFAESGVFGFLTLFLDFTVLSMGAVTALAWQISGFVSLLNLLPLYLLYNALRLPRLQRQLQELKAHHAEPGLAASGD